MVWLTGRFLFRIREDIQRSLEEFRAERKSNWTWAELGKWESEGELWRIARDREEKASKRISRVARQAGQRGNLAITERTNGIWEGNAGERRRPRMLVWGL